MKISFLCKKLIRTTILCGLGLCVAGGGLIAKEKEAEVFNIGEGGNCLVAYNNTKDFENKIVSDDLSALESKFREKYSAFTWVSYFLREVGTFLSDYGIVGCKEAPTLVKNEKNSFTYIDSYTGEKKTPKKYKMDEQSSCVALSVGDLTKGVVWQEVSNYFMPQFTKKEKVNYPWQKYWAITVEAANDYGVIGCIKKPRTTKKFLKFTGVDL